MLVWALVILAAWILLSFPVAVIVGRMFAGRHVPVVRRGPRPSADSERVAHLSLVEARPSHAARSAG